MGTAVLRGPSGYCSSSSPVRILQPPDINYLIWDFSHLFRVQRQLVFLERKGKIFYRTSSLNWTHSSICHEKHQLNLFRKHSRELSQFLREVLIVCIQTTAPHSNSHACVCLLSRRQHGSRISKTEAADMFWIQIDSYAFDNTAVEISTNLVVELFTVAWNSQNEGGTTADHVMDGVLRITKCVRRTKIHVNASITGMQKRSPDSYFRLNTSILFHNGRCSGSRKTVALGRMVKGQPP